MLSINIPVYNFEVLKLVRQLQLQANNLEINYEIRVYDDCSNEEIKSKNKEISSISNVIYKELNTNIGRAAIRNKMGLDSQKKYLLFIDADSQLINENYLQQFMLNAKNNRVLCGGTSYAKEKPLNSEQLLRWTYGTKREAITAESRNEKKGFIITSNNFLIERRVFENIHFRETLKTYGHEDTLLGYDLFKNGIEIHHIQNPVEHTGLESAETFIEKTGVALNNLKKILIELPDNNKDFISQLNFLNKYYRITKIIPPFILRHTYNNFEKRMRKNLTGDKPCLLWFDLYKLSYFATI